MGFHTYVISTNTVHIPLVIIFPWFKKSIHLWHNNSFRQVFNILCTHNFLCLLNTDLYTSTICIFLVLAKQKLWYVLQIQNTLSFELLYRIKFTEYIGISNVFQWFYLCSDHKFLCSSINLEMRPNVMRLSGKKTSWSVSIYHNTLMPWCKSKKEEQQRKSNER